MKLEAIAVQLPQNEEGHSLQIRAGSTAKYVNLYLEGHYFGDLSLVSEDGKPKLRLFLPKTNEPEYFEFDIHPIGREEFRTCRHKDFGFYDYDWKENH